MPNTRLVTHVPTKPTFSSQGTERYWNGIQGSEHNSTDSPGESGHNRCSPLLPFPPVRCTITTPHFHSIHLCLLTRSSLYWCLFLKTLPAPSTQCPPQNSLMEMHQKNPHEISTAEIRPPAQQCSEQL